MLVPGSAAADAPFCSQAAGGSAITVTCEYTGAPQRWQPPAGVSSASFTARGAAGGNKHGGHYGGQGAIVTGTMPATPGAIYEVRVGGVGTAQNFSTTECGIYGGYNGGANGGFRGAPADCTYSGWANGAGGGGASDIRTGAYGLADRLVVAGGGGGASLGFGGNANYNGERGGFGSETLDPSVYNYVGAFGGDGAGQSNGGAGSPQGPPSCSDFLQCLTGSPGTLGAGGTGAVTTYTVYQVGGGGGGGLYGGGGGNGGGTGGGGGSSTGPDGSSFSTGQWGNGEVTITYTTPNGRPTCLDRSLSLTGNTSSSVGLSCSDGAGATMHGYRIVSGPSHGTLGTIAADGSVTYTPASNYLGTDSFTYANDSANGPAATKTVSIDVDPPVPTCQALTRSTPSEAPLAITLNCSSTSGYANSYAIVAGPSHGALSAVDGAAGTVTYTSDSEYEGSDSFTYRTSNSSGTSSTVTVALTVTSLSPVCADIPQTGGAERAESITLSCTAPTGLTNTYSVVASPSHGSLSGLDAATGHVDYTPSPGFSGTDSFTYRATNSRRTGALATVTLTVLGDGAARSVSAGRDHACAVKLNGSVVCWGDQASGRSSPPGGTAAGITAVSAGSDHTCAISAAGSLFCWGADENGQVSNRPETGPGQSAGVPVNATAVASGNGFSCVLEDASFFWGAIECWGAGTDPFTGPLAPPFSAEGTSIAAGPDYACVVTPGATVTCWGNPPASVPGGLANVEGIAAGAEHTCGVTTAGAVVCWGSDAAGQTTVPAAAGAGVTQIAAGGAHTCALKDGGVLCWGGNAGGAATPPAAAASGVTAISAGDSYTCVVKSGGQTLCWGDNTSGRATAPAAAGINGASGTFAATRVGATSASQTATITNTGIASLVIASVAPVDGTAFAVTADACSGQTLAVNATCTVTTSFQPTAAGPVTDTLRVSSNGPTSTLALSGTGLQPAVSITGPSGAFGATRTGTTASPRTITITNSGTAVLNLAAGALTVAGADAARFPMSDDTCSGQSLAIAATCTVKVAFAPASTGAHTASLRIASDAAVSPSVVALSGSGIAPGLTLGAGGAFGSHREGTSPTTRSFVVTNTGSDTLTLPSAAVRLHGTDDFTIGTDGCSGHTVAVGASCSITVAFAPTATGDRSTELHIAGDAPGGPVERTLSGSGIDATVPTTKLLADGRPAAVTSSTSATFAYSATDAGDTGSFTYSCQLDGASFSACPASGVSYNELTSGAHTFTVRATDVSGNEDATGASHAWTVDTHAAAAPTLQQGPRALSGDRNGSVAFAGEAGATFMCTLDGAAPVACTSPFSYSGLADGAHALRIVPASALGVPGPELAVSWTIDSHVPAPPVQVGEPVLPLVARSGTVAFTGEAGATFTCTLDAATPVACASPFSYSGLADGRHQLSVVQTSRAGVLGPPLVVAWKIDTTAEEPSNTFDAPRTLRRKDGGLITTFTFPRAGTVELEATSGRVDLGREDLRSTRAADRRVRLKLTHAGKKLLARRGRLVVRLRTRFTPAGGRARVRVTTVTLPATR